MGRRNERIDSPADCLYLSYSLSGQHRSYLYCFLSGIRQRRKQRSKGQRFLSRRVASNRRRWSQVSPHRPLWQQSKYKPDCPTRLLLKACFLSRSYTSVPLLLYTVHTTEQWAKRQPWFNFCNNKAGYTATPVACGWAGAVFEVTWSLGQEQWGQRPQKKKLSVTDR